VRSTDARSNRLLRLALPLLALGVIFAGSILYEKMRSKVAAPTFRGLPCLLESNEAQFPIHLRGLRGVITEGDQAAGIGPPTLWLLKDVSGTFQLTHVLKTNGVLISAPAQGRTLSGWTAVDIAHWGATNKAAIFLLRQRRQAIEVAVEGLGPDRPKRIVGLAPMGEQPPYIHRDLALARFTGTRPDLFVVNRNVRSGAVTLSVFSGESRFRRPVIRNRTLPVAGLDPKRWVIDVGRSSSSMTDIFFVRRGRGSLTGTAEVHILTGASGYRSFALHSRITRRASFASMFAIGPSRSGPSLYSIGFGPGFPMLHITPLTSPRTSPSC
jgi:hypothetical protein